MNIFQGTNMSGQDAFRRFDKEAEISTKAPNWLNHSIVEGRKAKEKDNDVFRRQNPSIMEGRKVKEKDNEAPNWLNHSIVEGRKAKEKDNDVFSQLNPSSVEGRKVKEKDNDVCELVSRLNPSIAEGRKVKEKYSGTNLNAEEERKKEKPRFPWLLKINDFFRRLTVGVIQIKDLETLLTIYLQKVTPSVNDCLQKPKLATKLRTCLNRNLVFFHFRYQDIKEQSEDNSIYLEKMTELTAMYLDLEIASSRRRKETIKKVVSRMASALNLYLDCSEDHILDALMRAKSTKNTEKEVWCPILKKVLTSFQTRQMQDTLYVRFLLVFKLWKKVVNDAAVRKDINVLAIGKLPAPPNFTDRYKRFNNVLPRVPGSTKDITKFYIQAKFDVTKACENFRNISKDPTVPRVRDKPFFSDGQPQLTFGAKGNSFDRGVGRNLINEIWSSLNDESTSNKKTSANKKKGKNKKVDKKKEKSDSVSETKCTPEVVATPAKWEAAFEVRPDVVMINSSQPPPPGTELPPLPPPPPPPPPYAKPLPAMAAVLPTPVFTSKPMVSNSNIAVKPAKPILAVAALKKETIITDDPPALVKIKNSVVPKNRIKVEPESPESPPQETAETAAEFGATQGSSALATGQPEPAPEFEQVYGECEVELDDQDLPYIEEEVVEPCNPVGYEDTEPDYPGECAQNASPAARRAVEEAHVVAGPAEVAAAEAQPPPRPRDDAAARVSSGQRSEPWMHICVVPLQHIKSELVEPPEYGAVPCAGVDPVEAEKPGRVSAAQPNGFTVDKRERPPVTADLSSKSSRHRSKRDKNLFDEAVKVVASAKSRTLTSEDRTLTNKLQTFSSESDTLFDKLRSSSSEVNTLPNKVRSGSRESKTLPNKVRSSSSEGHIASNKVRSHSNEKPTWAINQTKVREYHTVSNKVRSSPSEGLISSNKVRRASGEGRRSSIKVHTLPSASPTSSPKHDKPRPPSVSSQPPRLDQVPTLQAEAPTPDKREKRHSSKPERSRHTNGTKLSPSVPAEAVAWVKALASVKAEKVEPSRHEMAPPKAQSPRADKCRSPWEEKSRSPRMERSHSPRVETYSPKAEAYSPRTETYLPRAEAYSPRTETYSPKVETYPPKVEAYSSRVETHSPRAEAYSLRVETPSPRPDTYSSRVEMHLPVAEAYSSRVETHSPRAEAYSSRVETHSPRLEVYSSRVETQLPIAFSPGVEAYSSRLETHLPGVETHSHSPTVETYLSKAETYSSRVEQTRQCLEVPAAHRIERTPSPQSGRQTTRPPPASAEAFVSPFAPHTFAAPKPPAPLSPQKPVASHAFAAPLPFDSTKYAAIPFVSPAIVADSLFNGGARPAEPPPLYLPQDMSPADLAPSNDLLLDDDFSCGHFLHDTDSFGFHDMYLFNGDFPAPVYPNESYDFCAPWSTSACGELPAEVLTLNDSSTLPDAADFEDLAHAPPRDGASERRDENTQCKAGVSSRKLPEVGDPSGRAAARDAPVTRKRSHSSTRPHLQENSAALNRTPHVSTLASRGGGQSKGRGTNGAKKEAASLATAPNSPGSPGGFSTHDPFLGGFIGDKDLDLIFPSQTDNDIIREKPRIYGGNERPTTRSVSKMTSRSPDASTSGAPKRQKNMR